MAPACCVNAGNAGGMYYKVRAFHSLRKEREIKNISAHNGNIRVVVQLTVRQRISMKVVIHNDFVVVDDPFHDGVRDEASATGNEICLHHSLVGS
jgi:hypothetical protein